MRIPTISIIAMLLTICGCAGPKQYYWGDYESSLYNRHLHAEAGETEALTSIEALLAESANIHSKVPPGVYADYGYLLLKQGRTDEALTALRQESELYPESKTFMNRMISRIEERKDGPDQKQEEKVRDQKPEQKPPDTTAEVERTIHETSMR